MKRPLIAACALVVAAGCSFGALYAVNEHKKKAAEKEASESADYILTDFDSTLVTNIRFEFKDGSVCDTVIDDEGFWSGSFEDGKTFPAASSSIDGICLSASALEAHGSYGEATEEKMKEYGLDQPYKLTFTLPDGEHTVSVGDNTATDTYTYVMVDDRNKIYTLESPTAAGLVINRLDLKSSDFMPFSENEIMELSASKDGQEVYSISRSDAGSPWTLGGKYSFLKVDQSEVSARITTMVRVSADQVLSDDPSELAEYGLDQPFAEFDVKSFDGSERHMLVAPCKSDTNYYYIYMDDTQQVGTYLRGDLRPINYTPFDYLEKRMTNVAMTIVSEFSFSCEAGGDQFTKDENGDFLCRDTKLDMTNAEVQSYFTAFYNSVCYFLAEGCDADNKPELKDPVFSSEFSSDTGESSSFDIVKEGDTYYAFMNGEFTGLTLDGEEAIGNVISSYKTLCEHTGIDPAIE
ncbi:MAG: DUF4340 domain-containing protein [Ruminococcus sp.]|nr:DUF4340 domain-containing protein [Ruminococcus sp.]